MILCVEYSGISEKAIQTAYKKGNWRANITTILDVKGDKILYKCEKVKACKTWGTSQNKATIDVYFSDGTEVTFLKAENIDVT